MFPTSTKMANTVSCLANAEFPQLTAVSVVDRVGIVKCDFSKYQDVNLRAGRMYGTSAAASRRGSRSVPLRCQIQLSTTTLEAAVLLDKERVGRCEIQIKVDPAQTDSSDFA